MNNKPYTTLIIDDEPPARTRLQQLLGNFPETFTVLDVAVNGNEAKEKIEKLTPDVIFLDIQMPGLTGFQVLEQLDRIPIVIFCTAYDQYALDAFETNSLDYLVKPVRLERLTKTVGKLKQFKKGIPSSLLLAMLKDVSLQEKVVKMTSITVKKGDKLVFIKLDTVVYFQAKDKYVEVSTAKGNHLVEQSLAQLEKKLPQNFLRVHKSFVINKNCVKDVQKYFNGRYIISFADGKTEAITTGRSYGVTIKEWIAN